MATNPNETYPYTIVHATRWSKGGQTDGGENGPTFGGSAYPSREAAHAAFMREYLAHNTIYRAGTISHLPGVAK